MSVRLSDEVPLVQKIPNHPSVGIEDQDICVFSDQFTDDSVCAVLACKGNFHDAVVWYLADFIDSGALNMGSEKLAKGRRRLGIGQVMGCQVQAGCLRSAGNEKPMGLSRNANIEYESVIGGLVNFLYPSTA